MQFTYKEDKKRTDCVAFLFEGSLYIKTSDGGNIVLVEGGGCYKGGLKFNDLRGDGRKDFYPGDQVTITF